MTAEEFLAAYASSKLVTQQIEQYNQSVKVLQAGTVVEVKDGTAWVYGLDQVMAGELLEFEDGTFGIAQDEKEGIVRVVLKGEGHDVQLGSSVTASWKNGFYGKE